ncbi:MAG TPA: 23S rRNA (guanosine(2251)-2'-O)-methyltransferase RlmB [Bacillota bacterium]|jgi:23S rRNA (guanosine2251-2'-O)-methyltransferase|nr:23S rRNA (guanosine(2251)-2'-O)-methyltransferase RlmB [Fastidiosipila sp.]HPX93418.1 23S rRNA (guanosine(2251)-2'-O)-methyltransferase RlmB [Bacillota bacterium]HQB81190.1 23S rRNA (guanosine(2251)-2'-O)-methyltransferase RlmB [Bacillota bacterium]
MSENRDHDLELTRLEGRNPVAEALAAGRSLNRVYVLENARGDLAALAARCRQQGARVDFVSRAVLDSMALTRAHQGIIAEAAPYAYSDLNGILQTCKEEGRDPFLLLLDHIQDANNLGSILRVADGAGIDAVVIPRHRSAPLNAAVAKASAGAVEHLPLCRVNNLTQTILMLKDQGFWIFGTSAVSGTCYKDADYGGSIALVVGSEGEGMSKMVAQHCDFLLSIPLRGRINSLNAAVACGIIVFEAVSRRGKKEACSDP